MHKITKHVMDAEEATRPTPCSADPERWFPDEQKPDPYAVAACWSSCYFQGGCARRALAVAPEHGVWGGYRLAPGPGLARTLEQLKIVAGVEMGPAVPPAPEIVAALEDLAGISTTSAAASPAIEVEEVVYRPLEIVATTVALDEWREPSDLELLAAEQDELDALAYPLDVDFPFDGRGQILLPLLDGASPGGHAAVKRAS